MLLKEVLSLNPYENGEKWNDVASNFNVALKVFRPSTLQVNTRSVKERVETLLRIFKSQQLESLRKLGCAEEYSEREQLLTEQTTLKDESPKQQIKQNTKSEVLFESGLEIRKRALETLGPVNRDKTSEKKKAEDKFTS
ncbi:uncharacterized protein [Antedon mediterranea]|uniref:uncharacterized protein n=1 Tax=Antedon mediterranea TaxID=105859 RepID=UPI003AF4A4C2